MFRLKMYGEYFYVSNQSKHFWFDFYTSSDVRQTFSQILEEVSATFHHQTEIKEELYFRGWG